VSTVPLTWQIPESLRQRFGQKGLGKQRAMVAEGHLLLVLHKPPQPGSRQREGLLFWRQPSGNWKSTTGVDGLATLNRHLKDFGGAEQQLLMAYEQASSADDYFQVLEDLGPLKLATRNLHAALQTAREGIPEAPELIDLRDAAYEVERTLELLHLDSNNALELALAKQAELQSRLSLKSVRTAQRLNLLAAIFLPLTALASVFGMNLSSGLENSSPIVFWLIFGLGVLAGLGLRTWIARDKPM
jgi:hypothetical protein